MEIPVALSFDDVLLKPSRSEVVPADANLLTTLSRNISLQIPLISSPMDTVTEAKMAIALASLGGIGIIHKNNTLAEQAIQVKQVKKFESGVVNGLLDNLYTGTIYLIVGLKQNENHYFTYS